jgi:hypothetical protein
VGMTTNNARCPPHHWKLESPDGPICKGRCQKCGAERDFPAVYEWHREWQASGAAKMPPFVRKRP